jgi:hypothetical protein
MRAFRGMHWFFSIGLFPLIVLAVGCGIGGGTVSGKVYYKGTVVTRGSVTFLPEGKGGNFTAVIGSDGSYSISKLPPGPAKIIVLVGRKTPPPSAARMMSKGKHMEMINKAKSKAEGGKADSSDADKDTDISVPEKYTDPEKSGLKIDVTGGKQTFDIKLE